MINLESDLNKILNLMPFCVMLVKMDKSIYYVNQAVVDFAGYSKQEEMIGEICNSVICPAEKDMCPILDLGQKLDKTERKAVTKDGRPIPIMKSAVPISIGGEEMLLEAFIDISERKKVEEFNKSILESIGEALIVINKDFKILTANKSFCQMVGKTQDQLIGKECHEEYLNPGKLCDETAFDCPATKTFESGSSNYAIINMTREGTKHYHEIKTYPLPDDTGKITSVIVLINDITEKIKLEEQLRHSQKMEAIGTLTGGIAHDFNNLLTSIIGFGEFLQQAIDNDDPLRSYVDMILMSGDKAASLTQSLLTFSRKQIINPANIDINEVLRKSEKLLSRLIGENIKIILKLSGSSMPIFADSIQLEQVFMNLATNARDAMPEGGELIIASEIISLDQHFIEAHGFGKPGDYALISISDTGTGMPRDVRKKIFEPFFTTKDIGKGTGLGLSVAYGIIKQNGGHITAYSEEGHGTIFKIFIPLVSGTTEITKVEEPEPLPVGNETVLVAEDDDNVRDLIRIALEKYGYTVLQAANGQEAVDMFAKNKDIIDMLIFDIMMPVMNGIEAYKQIRTTHGDTKVLFVSGYPVDLVKKYGMPDDIDILLKPISPSSIVRTARKTLNDIS